MGKVCLKRERGLLGGRIFLCVFLWILLVVPEEMVVVVVVSKNWCVLWMVVHCLMAFCILFLFWIFFFNSLFFSQVSLLRQPTFFLILSLSFALEHTRFLSLVPFLFDFFFLFLTSSLFLVLGFAFSFFFLFRFFVSVFVFVSFFAI